MLTPVVQWLFFVVLSLFSDMDDIRCSNWHGETSRCSIFDALFGNVFSVLLVNVATMGIAFIVFYPLSAISIVVFRALVPPAFVWTPSFWVKLTCVLLAVLLIRAVQTTDFGSARKEPTKEITVIIRSGGGSAEVNP